MKSLRFLSAILAFVLAGFLSGCKDDDPKKEDTPELITKATLTFTPSGGGSAVVVSATDPDGIGVQDIAPDGPIDLAANETYTMTITLINELAEIGTAEYNITHEVEEEGVEHMFFFSWTNDVFSNPSGNGNFDNRNDVINYNDEDENSLPIGLSTTWTTTDISADGTFRVVLKHQPDLKSGTSNSSTGETDLDVVFDVTID